MSEFDEEKESLSFAQYLEDNEIISKATKLPQKELEALWDVHGDEYMEYCKLYDFDYEIIG